MIKRGMEKFIFLGFYIKIIKMESLYENIISIRRNIRRMDYTANNMLKTADNCIEMLKKMRGDVREATSYVKGRREEREYLERKHNLHFRDKNQL